MKSEWNGGACGPDSTHSLNKTNQVYSLSQSRPLNTQTKRQGIAVLITPISVSFSPWLFVTAIKNHINIKWINKYTRISKWPQMTFTVQLSSKLKANSNHAKGVFWENNCNLLAELPSRVESQCFKSMI